MGKFYAAAGQISRAPIAGGIEITEAEYRAALGGMLSGQIVTIEGGALIVQDPPKPAPAPVQEPAPATVADVKAEAARRLYSTDWYVIRAAEGGAAVPETVTAYRAAVRAASGEIEALDPIPEDYYDDSRWPAVVS